MTNSLLIAVHAFVSHVSMSVLVDEMAGEKTWRQLRKNAVSNIEQILEATPHKAAALRPPTNHHQNYPN